MVAPITLELDYKGKRYIDVTRGLDALAGDFGKDTQKILPIAKRLINLYMEGVVKSVAQRMQTPWPAGTSPPGQYPGTLSKRSGRLVAQFTPANIVVKGTSTDVSAAFTLPGIAAVHEFGATIRPKRAKYLTVPLPAALNRRGLPLKPNARAWKDAFVVKSKKGNLLIVRRKGDGIEPLYVLKKEVKIPRRLAFKDAFDAGLDFLADQIAKEVVREFFGGQ